MAEKHLVAAERDRQDLRAILDTAPECIALLNRDTQLIDINLAGLTMLHATVEVSRGADLSRQVMPGAPRAVRRIARTNFLWPAQHAPIRDDELHWRAIVGRCARRPALAYR